MSRNKKSSRKVWYWRNGNTTMVSSFEFPNVLAWTKGQTPALAAFIAVNRCDIKRVPLNVKGLKRGPGALIMAGRDIEFRVGRRSVDGTIRLSELAPQLLQLTVSYKGERSSSVVLTRSQIQAFRQALGEYELAMAEEDQSETWDKNERRAG